jgi:hypothetical protein
MKEFIDDETQASVEKLIDSNARCSYLKKFTCKGTLRQVFICLRPRTLYPPPLTHCIRVYIMYTKSHREGGMGGGGRVESVRGLDHRWQ